VTEDLALPLQPAFVPPSLIRIVDTETTGLKDPAEMVEIGWTDIVLTRGGWVIDDGPHSLIVNPGMPIPFPAMAVHHITEADVAEGVDPEQARRLILNGADMLASHNWAYDIRFIRTKAPAICTYKCALTLWPDLQSHGNGSIRYERGYCIGDDRAYPPHRAGPDTWITAHILLDILTEISVERAVEITENPVELKRINFGEHDGKLFTEVPWDYLHWIVHKSKMPTDPERVNEVFTARAELARRQAENAAQNVGGASDVDPDGWRRTLPAATGGAA